MRTERTRPEPNGFTLLEVLVAMLILAVGLLGLEALGIGAARALTQAQHRTQLTTAATRAMEERTSALRSNPAGAVAGSSCATDAQANVRICTDVQTRLTNAQVPRNTARVTVAAQRTVGAPHPYSITSYVHHPLLP